MYVHVGPHIVTVPVLILDRPVSRLGPAIPELRHGSKKCPQLQYGDFHFVTPVNHWRCKYLTSGIKTGHPVLILDVWYVQYQYWTRPVSRLDLASIDTGHPVLILGEYNMGSAGRVSLMTQSSNWASGIDTGVPVL